MPLAEGLELRPGLHHVGLGKDVSFLREERLQDALSHINMFRKLDTVYT